MKLLDKVLLKKYLGKDLDKYILARNLSVVLIIIWLLTAVLSFLSLTNQDITIEVVYIFIIVNMALLLVQFDKINIAIPITLIGSNIAASLLVFAPAAVFGVYEVYKLAFFQLVILGIAGLITYKQYYAYLMTAFGIIAIILQFFFRGLKLNKAHVLTNFEDYIVAVILLFLSGFILGKVITQKQKTMSKLVENEEKYSSVVNNSKDGILIHQDGLIKFINKAAIQLTGYNRDSIISRSIVDFLKPAHKPVIQNFLDLKGNEQHIPDIVEVKVVHKNGTSIDIESRRTKIIFEGERSTLLFLRDITERKKIQESMVQSEKMLSLGGLAAGMAHEINNPLAGIMQNAQVIKNRLEKDSPANIKAAKELGMDLTAMRAFLKERKIFNQLDRIREAGTRAAEIVTNMLGFARKEQNKSSHDLRELLDKTVEMAESDYSLKKKYDFRSINIVRKYEENLPMVVCDPGQIQQVFLNLLKNGAEAMSAPSVLRQAQHGAGSGTTRSTSSGTTRSTGSGTTHDILEKAQFILTARQKGKMVRVEIENNLCGIPEELQRRIFEPFFTTKPVGVGTGLGLSVSYFIIHETHNGELRVESDGKSWVKFIIELPFN